MSTTITDDTMTSTDNVKTFDDYPAAIQLAVLYNETEAMLTHADRIERANAATFEDITTAYSRGQGVEDYWTEQQGNA